MTSSNTETLDTYETHVQEYIDNTDHQVSGFLKNWIDEVLALVPVDGDILELGSAFGRDADYMESHGYKVRRTDATRKFVELLRQQGHEATNLNAITDDLGGPYDLVFANAVLLHFTPEEFTLTLAKVHDALKPGGVFACSLKRGTGSEMSVIKLGAPRYFKYWEVETVRPELDNFEIVNLENDSDNPWLHVIARKPD
ncbi:class I SAM-dependent methyltransferase [Candidatus Saccharibacteria bacterium]|nr:class I SAM-dependent methyltransferase [Candidatus Saccharibacteria bacterium]